MSTTTAARSPAPSTSVDALLGAGLAPITLTEVLAEAELQTRVDRKYIVDRAIFDRMVEEVGPSLRCLTIEGRTCARYRSVYFDTADLDLFHHHLQGRRRRFKVRTRSYLDSGASVLEVKAKGLRSVTVKERLPWPDDAVDRLARRGDGFVAETIASEAYRGALAPALETHYRRATLVDERSHSRITCDTEIRFRRGAAEVSGLRGEVLVETKSVGGHGATDRWLRDQGVRPESMSKYCLGIALLYPQVRANPWHRVLRRHFDWPADGPTPEVPAG